MRKILLVISFFLVAHSHAKDKLLGKSVFELFERPFMATSLHHANLDNTTWGKATKLVMSPSGRSTYSRFAVSSGGFEPAFLLRLQRGCGVSCSKDWHETVQLQPTSTQLSGRRHAGLVFLSGLASPSAFAKNDDENFIEGPAGIKYQDIVVGGGAIPFNGDTLTVCDVPFECGDAAATDGELISPGAKIDGKSFVFTVGTDQVLQGWNKALLGEGDMPPMKVGSTRKVLIPPELGYGRRGINCKPNGKPGGDCEIPPGSTLEFVIQLVGIARKKQ